MEMALLARVVIALVYHSYLICSVAEDVTLWIGRVQDPIKIEDGMRRFSELKAMQTEKGRLDGNEIS